MDLYHHQLIVLGNGFDIALGLNTGYADYFNSNYGECPQMDHNEKRVGYGHTRPEAS